MRLRRSSARFSSRDRMRAQDAGARSSSARVRSGAARADRCDRNRHRELVRHPYHGRRAASGEIYDMEKFTAAHRTLPFGTWVEVHQSRNGKRVDVRIIDRGPFVDGRIIDLSLAAARTIDMVGPGTARVRLKVIAPPTFVAKTSPPPAPTPESARAPATLRPSALPVPVVPTSVAPAVEYYAIEAGSFFRSRSSRISSGEHSFPI